MAAARRLRDHPVDVRLVVPGGRVGYLPGTLDVVLGAADAGRFDQEVTISGVTVDGRSAEAVAGNGVRLDGTWVPADAVIAAPGLVPRAAVGLEVPGAVAFWDPVAAAPAARAVAALEQGTIAVVIAGLPYRCPPAPFGLAMRLAAWMRAQGRPVRVLVTTPEPRPLAGLGEVPGRFLLDAAAAAGVEIHTGTAVDPDALAVGRLVTAAGDGPEADLLLVVPPHGPSPLLAELAAGKPVVEVGPGFTTSVPGLHVVGDAAATPYPRAAEPASVGGEVAADAVAAHLGLGEPPAPRVPNAACYVGHGDGAYSRLRLSYPDGPPPTGAARVEVDGPSAGLEADFRAAEQEWRKLRRD
jgi:sulfide:quinone oxidoreductase